MKLSTAAKLGRVSNLPTVWTNVLAGCVLAGAAYDASTLLRLGLVATLLYVAGMFLNDAFDAEFDAQHRPERPIPSGEVSRQAVLRCGFGMLAVALLLAGTLGGRALLAAGATAIAVVVYDLHHKQVAHAPVIMALCRVGLYLTAAFALVAWPPPAVWWGALALLGYVIGLSFVAKHENQASLVRWLPLLGVLGPLIVCVPLLGGPLTHVALFVGVVLWLLRAIRLARGGTPQSIRAGVVALIAGISLVDALLIAAQGHFELVPPTVLAFGLTLALQRAVAGT